uniref:(northern house mosquito) hypothetical protein n=1 Tax=Culex pipiens TaxID=7175 RepID=A0A8D8C2E0_CULPI
MVGKWTWAKLMREVDLGKIALFQTGVRVDKSCSREGSSIALPIGGTRRFPRAARPSRIGRPGLRKSRAGSFPRLIRNRTTPVVWRLPAPSSSRTTTLRPLALTAKEGPLSARTLGLPISQ